MLYVRFLLIAACFFAAYPAYAQYNPGDACSSAGAYHTKNTANSVETFICDGSNWRRVSIVDFSANAVTLGFWAGQNMTGAIQNTFIGHNAGSQNVGGSDNTFIGEDAGKDNTAGGGNIFIGKQAGKSSNGNNNIFIGTDTGTTHITGNQNILIGNNVDVSANGLSDKLNIGNTIYANMASDFVGIGNASPNVALDVTGNIEYTGTLADVSDRRMKIDIIPLSGQLARVAALEGVSFVMKDDPQKQRELGLIAQDVETVYPELVKTSAEGVKSLNYIGLTAPIIEAVKELKTENDQLRQDNAAIRARLHALENRLLAVQDAPVFQLNSRTRPAYNN
jgi:hypothetical protein